MIDISELRRLEAEATPPKDHEQSYAFSASELALYQAMRNALPELLKALEWQPIETAPKDGTYVLACRAHSILPLIIRFDKKYGEWESEQGDHVYNILGWRPLPLPPHGGGDEG